MTRIIKWLTNQYTRLWLRWHWARGRRRVTSDEYVKAMVEVNAADYGITALEKKQFAMQFICACCRAIAITGVDSLYTGTTLRCDECGMDTVVVLIKGGDYSSTTESPNDQERD